jgi:2,3-bisphosphoglycerate-independent phosphoglycerate mutase
MKYIVIIGDGLAGWPTDSKEGKTALELANTPNLDYLAKNSEVGLANNTPNNFLPGSDICNLSIFGYNPAQHYSGRAPIEAVAQGIYLDDNDTVFRVNLVRVEDGKMKDFTADHISNNDAKECINILNSHFSNDENIEFYSGVSYRNLCKIKNKKFQLKTYPPHDITDSNINKYLPTGEFSEIINEIMNISEKLFPENIYANMAWLWGEGKKMTLPSFEEKYNLKGAVITAVDLIKGLGLSAGMDLINVPGVTGYLDTNYEGKARYALDGLKKYDLVIIHVEAPDEAGHTGDLSLKIKAIEDFDKRVIGVILQEIKFEDYKLLVLPDHATPIEIKTHSSDNIPYIIYNNKKEKVGVPYTEKEVASFSKQVIPGHQLMKIFLQ